METTSITLTAPDGQILGYAANTSRTNREIWTLTTPNGITLTGIATSIADAERLLTDHAEWLAAR